MNRRQVLSQTSDSGSGGGGATANTRDGVDPSGNPDASPLHSSPQSNQVNENYPRPYPSSNSSNTSTSLFRHHPLQSRYHTGPRPPRNPSSLSGSTRHDSDMPLSQTNIYIRGLPPDFSANDLNELCAKFGRIVSTKAVIDPDSQRCRGYGFIDFESAQAASEALKSINSEGVYEAEMAKEIRGRSVEKFQHLEQDPTNLYIANLPRDFTESSIREMLSGFGTVISTRVLRNPDGSSRCVGFARMDSKESCDQIIAQYNGKTLQEDSDQLIVKLADSGARRPKNSTSSSGQSSDQAGFYSNWPGVQAGRFSYPSAIAAGANYPADPNFQQFSPILPNSGFQVFDPFYHQSMGGAQAAAGAVPVGVHQYPNIVYSPTRQIPTATASAAMSPQAPPTPSQLVYQGGGAAAALPLQQASPADYAKMGYKAQQGYQTSAGTYYPAYVPYGSEYVVNQPQYVQSPTSYTTANIASEAQYVYTNGGGNPIYLPGQFYPQQPQQLLPQMFDQMSLNPSKADAYGQPAYDPQQPNDQTASAEKYDSVGGNPAVDHQAVNVRSYASEPKLNNA